MELPQVGTVLAANCPKAQPTSSRRKSARGLALQPAEARSPHKVTAN